MKTFVLHDETLNTYGFRMLTDGADLTEFLKNPVMLFNHDDWTLPIGRWENIRKEGGKILAEPVFDLKDERGQKVSQKVEDGFLKAASIGAWPPIELSEEPSTMLPGQKKPTVTKWKVREASIVAIGANHNALVFYDENGEKINLQDANQIIKLFDIQKPKKGNMNELNKILNLADTATDVERETAVRALLNSNVQLTDQLAEKTKELEALELADRKRKQTESVALVDSAIKDGRINAEAKEHFIKLFDADFDNAVSILNGLPKRRSVTEQIESANAQMADLQKSTWDELDRKGKLRELKDSNPALYAEKYKEKFGIEPRQ